MTAAPHQIGSNADTAPVGPLGAGASSLSTSPGASAPGAFEGEAAFAAAMAENAKACNAAARKAGWFSSTWNHRAAGMKSKPAAAKRPHGAFTKSVIDTMRAHGKPMASGDIWAIVGGSRDQVRDSLINLQKKGRVQSDGYGKSRRWWVVE